MKIAPYLKAIEKTEADIVCIYYGPDFGARDLGKRAEKGTPLFNKLLANLKKPATRPRLPGEKVYGKQDYIIARSAGIEYGKEGLLNIPVTGTFDKAYTIYFF